MTRWYDSGYHVGTYMYIYLIIDDVDEMTEDEIKSDHITMAWSGGWIDMIALKKK